MFKFGIFLAILFIKLIYCTAATDYCDPVLCENNAMGGSHIGCNNTGEFFPTCEEPSHIPLTTQMQATIIQKHNEMRNQVANGELPGFSSAKRMTTMTWDSDLAFLAKLNVLQCQMRHDECHNTFEYRFSGQNLGFRAQSTEFVEGDYEEGIVHLINEWFAEHQYANQSVVDEFSHDPVGKEIGHFTAMIQQKSAKIGCAYAQFKHIVEGKAWNAVLLACNYSFTNMIGLPIYVAGPAASGCKSGTNPEFAALCSATENFPPSPHDDDDDDNQNETGPPNQPIGADDPAINPVIANDLPKQTPSTDPAINPDLTNALPKQTPSTDPAINPDLANVLPKQSPSTDPAINADLANVLPKQTPSTDPAINPDLANALPKQLPSTDPAINPVVANALPKQSPSTDPAINPDLANALPKQTPSTDPAINPDLANALPKQTPSTDPAINPDLANALPKQTPSTDPAINPDLANALPKQSPSTDPAINPDLANVLPKQTPSTDPAINPNLAKVLPKQSPSTDPAINSDLANALPKQTPSTDPAINPDLANVLPKQSPSTDPAINSDHANALPKQSPSTDPAINPDLANALPKQSPSTDPAINPDLANALPKQTPSTDPAINPVVANALPKQTPSTDPAINPDLANALPKQTPSTDPAINPVVANALPKQTPSTDPAINPVVANALPKQTPSTDPAINQNQNVVCNLLPKQTPSAEPVIDHDINQVPAASPKAPLMNLSKSHENKNQTGLDKIPVQESQMPIPNPSLNHVQNDDNDVDQVPCKSAQSLFRNTNLMKHSQSTSPSIISVDHHQQENFQSTATGDLLQRLIKDLEYLDAQLKKTSYKLDALESEQPNALFATVDSRRSPRSVKHQSPVMQDTVPNIRSAHLPSSSKQSSASRGTITFEDQHVTKSARYKSSDKPQGSRRRDRSEVRKVIVDPQSSQSKRHRSPALQFPVNDKGSNRINRQLGHASIDKLDRVNKPVNQPGQNDRKVPKSNLRRSARTTQVLEITGTAFFLLNLIAAEVLNFLD